MSNIYVLKHMAQQLQNEEALKVIQNLSNRMNLTFRRWVDIALVFRSQLINATQMMYSVYSIVLVQ